MKSKKVIIWTIYLVIGVFIFFSIGIYFPRPEPDRSRKLFCGQKLHEQIANAVAIYDVVMLDSRETRPYGEVCVYDLNIDEVLAGSPPSALGVKALIEENSYSPINSFACKPVGKHYVLLTTIGYSENSSYRCGNSALYDVSRKQEIQELIRKKGM